MNVNKLELIKYFPRILLINVCFLTTNTVLRHQEGTKMSYILYHMYAFLWSSELHYPFSEFDILILQSLLTKDDSQGCLSSPCQPLLRNPPLLSSWSGLFRFFIFPGISSLNNLQDKMKDHFYTDTGVTVKAIQSKKNFCCVQSYNSSLLLHFLSCRRGHQRKLNSQNQIIGQLAPEERVFTSCKRTWL